MYMLMCTCMSQFLNELCIDNKNVPAHAHFFFLIDFSHTSNHDFVSYFDIKPTWSQFDLRIFKSKQKRSMILVCDKYIYW